MKKIWMIVLFAATISHVFSQEEILPHSPRGFISTGASLQIWRVENTEYKPIIQTVIPVNMVFPVNQDFNLNINTSYASTDGKVTTLYGLTDAWIQGNYMLFNHKILLSAGLGVPIGKSELSREYFELAKWIGFNVFDFRVPVYGQGLCTKIGVSLAYPVFDRFLLGVGGHYLYRGEYTPVTYKYGQNLEHLYDEKFTPGNDAVLNLGVDVSLTENQKVMVDAIITQYGRDVLGETPVYRAGRKMTFHSGYFIRYEEYYFFALYTHRTSSKNQFIQGLTFREESLNGNGPQNQLNLIWQPFRMTGGDFSLLFDGKWFDRNEYGNQKAYTWGGGFGGNFRLSYSTLIQFHFKYHVGMRESSDNVEGHIEGMDTMLGLKYEF